MRRWILAIIVLFALLVPIFAQSGQFSCKRCERDFARKLIQWSNGIVLVYSERLKATGFFVSKDGWLLTNLHIADKEFISIFKLYVKLDVGFEQRTFKSQKIIPHHSYDLLLVKIDYKPKYWFSRFRNPYLFEKTWVMGFRFNAGKSLAGPGYVSLDTHYPYLLRSTLCGVPGNSGSPVLNSSGIVVGVVVMVYKNTCDTLFIPGNQVKKFIEEALNEAKSIKGAK